MPVEELNGCKGGGVHSCSCGDPVQSSLSDVDKVKIFVTLQKNNNNRKYKLGLCFETEKTEESMELP